MYRVVDCDTDTVVIEVKSAEELKTEIELYRYYNGDRFIEVFNDDKYVYQQF